MAVEAWRIVAVIGESVSQNGFPVASASWSTKKLLTTKENHMYSVLVVCTIHKLFRLLLHSSPSNGTLQTNRALLYYKHSLNQSIAQSHTFPNPGPLRASGLLVTATNDESVFLDILVKILIASFTTQISAPFHAACFVLLPVLWRTSKGQSL